jgi:uncharacterized protein DUF1552
MLRGAGGILVGLPSLEAMFGTKVAGAEESAAPRRLVVFYTPNGTNCGNGADIKSQTDFWPADVGPNFVLGKEVAPLESLRSHLLIGSGMNGESCKADVTRQDQSSSHIVGDLHSIGLAQMLTGVATAVDGSTIGLIEGANPSAYGQGISVDQYIASKVSFPTKFPTLEFGVQNTTDYGVLPFSRMIYSGTSQPVPAGQDPVAMFARMFSDEGGGSSDMVKVAIAQRKSVLDFVLDDFSSVQKGLGKGDRERLDQHATHIRSLETRLTKQLTAEPIQTADCGTVQPPDSPGDANAKANFPAIGKLQMDMVVLALKCDLTRIASMQWSWARSDLVHGWAAATHGHHGMTHEGQSAELSAVNTWYASQLAYLGQQLLDTKDGTGASLLDSTLVYWGSDVAWAYTHSFDNMRAFFLGSGGGFFKTGQHVDLGGQAHQKLLVSFMNMMGLNEDHFGDTTFGTGPMTGLHA